MSATSKIITIDLLRHGEPEGGDVLRGRIDHVLTEAGWQQMHHAIARGLTTQEAQTAAAQFNWTHVVSSPLRRCRAFAEALAQEHEIALEIAECWQEIDYGDWDGMALPEWREQAGPMFREFRQDMSRLVPPNGEAFIVFKDRVLQAWDRLAELPDGSRVLLVTHGGVLRVILPMVLGMPLNRSQPLHIPFASYSRVSMLISGGTTDRRIANSLVFHNAAH